MADPRKRFGPRRKYIPPHAAPRIIFFDGSIPHKLPPPPGPHDQIDATRLAMRLAGIGRAPGWRQPSKDEINEILADLQYFARETLRAPDTS